MTRCGRPVILATLLAFVLGLAASGRAQSVGGADYDPAYDFSEF